MNVQPIFTIRIAPLVRQLRVRSRSQQEAPLIPQRAVALSFLHTILPTAIPRPEVKIQTRRPDNLEQQSRGAVKRMYPPVAGYECSFAEALESAGLTYYLDSAREMSCCFSVCSELLTKASFLSQNDNLDPSQVFNQHVVPDAEQRELLVTYFGAQRTGVSG